jgi:hypothetical protein
MVGRLLGLVYLLYNLEKRVDSGFGFVYIISTPNNREERE